MPIDRDEIAKIVEDTACLLFAGAKPPTLAIKREFRDVGRRHGYFIAAGGFYGTAPDLDGEWLYDLTWYVGHDGFFESLPLVVEVENLPDPKIDGDFGKLVQARAEVRLWICKLPRRQSLEEHLTIYKRQVNCFAGTQSGDIYIFVIYDHGGEKAHIERFVAPDPQRPAS
jgi:hypothetical protein